MILEIVTLDFEKIFFQLMTVFITWVIVVFAIGIDLYFGIQKSKANKIPVVHSWGLKQTTKKTVNYLAFMAFFFFLDVLNPFWIYFDYQSMPLLSIFGAIVLVYTEYKSVRENANEKFGREFDQNAKEILTLLRENKEFIDGLKTKTDDRFNQDNSIHNPEN